MKNSYIWHIHEPYVKRDHVKLFLGTSWPIAVNRSTKAKTGTLEAFIRILIWGK